MTPKVFSTLNYAGNFLGSQARYKSCILLLSGYLICTDLPADCLLLCRYKICIKTRLCNQLLVCSALFDFRMVEYKDLIRMSYCFQAVCDHDDRLILGQSLDRVLLLLK